MSCETRKGNRQRAETMNQIRVLKEECTSVRRECNHYYAALVPVPFRLSLPFGFTSIWFLDWNGAMDQDAEANVSSPASRNLVLADSSSLLGRLGNQENTNGTGSRSWWLGCCSHILNALQHSTWTSRPHSGCIQLQSKPTSFQ